MSDELNDVRAQLQNPELFAPGVFAEIDALRASVHEQLRARGIGHESPEYERTWLFAGGVKGQLLASPQTTHMLAGIENDDHRGAMASLLFWNSDISPHPAEAVFR